MAERRSSGKSRGKSANKSPAHLGWVVNLSKSSLTPSQTMTYLGFEINSVRQVLTLPHQKVLTLQEAVRFICSETIPTSGIRLPSGSFNPNGTEEAGEGTSDGAPSSSMVAEEILVFDSGGTIGSEPLGITSEHSSPISGAYILSRPPMVEVNSLDPEVSLLQKKGFSASVINTLLSSRKTVTRRIYLKVWKTFNSWKTENSRTSFKMPIILDFLQEGVNKGLSVNTLKVQLAALSVFLDRKLSSISIIKRFLLAVKRSRAAPCRVIPQWDLAKVLLLSSPPFYPNKNLDIKWLTWKVLFLVAITSARRVSDIQALSCRHPFLQVFTDRIVLKVDPCYLPKVASDFHRSQENVIPSVAKEDPELKALDVRFLLLQYLNQTKGFRKADSLFITFSGPRKGLRVSKTTLDRWMKDTIKLAYSTVAIADLSSEDAAKRRAALESAIRRKIETEKRAHQIVERLLEDRITDEFLLDCARFISPSHYKDVIEERSIIKLCGYPVCNKTLENVPKQKYKISTRTNKVYDITERKCFCSDFCYRASKYYETQIPTTPLWTRDEESPPEIKLLKEGKRGHSGEEVKLAQRRIRPSEIDKLKPVTESHDSSSSDGERGEDEQEQAFVSTVITPKEQNPKYPRSVQESTHNMQETSALEEHNQNVLETAERLSSCNINDCERTSALQGKDIKVTADTTENVNFTRSSAKEVTGVTQRAVSKRGAEHLRKLLLKSKGSLTVVKPSVVTVKGSMLDILTQTLNEWKSEETLKYLFGMNYVIGPPVHKDDVPVICDQMEDLDEDDIHFEIAEQKNSSLNECLHFRTEHNVSKPLPDYTKLKEETKLMELRVSEFFKGHCVLPEEVENKKSKGTEHPEKDTAISAPPLPLVDSCSQQQIRRGIVLEKLKKVLPAILVPLQITYSDVSKELHNLVKTLRFTNKNINHSTPEWSIIAIVLMSALLPTMPLHKDSQKNPLYTEFISRLLEELQFQSEDLDFLKNTFSSNTLSSSFL
ncbi:putative RNA polymerase II subunit B1 CTD phosphatase RPAP2 [Gastrophryne carolinensis]